MYVFWGNVDYICYRLVEESEKAVVTVCYVFSEEK